MTPRGDFTVDVPVSDDGVIAGAVRATSSRGAAWTGILATSPRRRWAWATSASGVAFAVAFACPRLQWRYRGHSGDAMGYLSSARGDRHRGERTAAQPDAKDKPANRDARWGAAVQILRLHRPFLPAPDVVLLLP